MSNLPADITPHPLHAGETPALRVVACPHPFKQGHEEQALVPGRSLLEILQEVQPDISQYSAHVWVNDDYIAPEKWVETYPAPGSEIAIRVIPQGEAGRIIGMIFIAVAMIATAVFLGPGAFGIVGLGLPGWAAGLGAMAVGIIGNLVLNAICPPTRKPGRQAQLAGWSQDSPTLSIAGASNAANKWGPIPLMLGRHRMYPPYGAESYTEVVGNDQYLRLLFIWGFAPAELQDLKIGDTPLDSYEGVEVEHRNLTLVLTSQNIAIDVTAKTLTRSSGSWITDGLKDEATITLEGCTTPANNTTYVISQVTALVLTYSTSTATTTEAGTGEQTVTVAFGADPLTLYTNDVHEEQLSILLEQNDPQVRTTLEGISEITLDLICPNGLYSTNSQTGNRQSMSVQVRIEICETGSGNWQQLEVVTLSAATSSAVRRGLRYAVTVAGAYDLRLTRLTGPDSNLTMSLIYWSALRSISATNPFQPPVPCAMTVLRIKASNQLSGIVDKFSGIVTSICPDWDGENWVTQPTNNPASLYRHAVQGGHKQKPLVDGRLSLKKLEDWHEFCGAQGFTYNKIIDYSAPQKEILDEIAAAGRAAFSWIDNQLGVIIDQPQEFNIGPAFTPRNSANFSSSIAYPDLPHAFRVPFRNEENDWQEDERLVLRDGYALLDPAGNKRDAWDEPAPDLPLATIVEQLELPGQTHPDNIFKLARYHLAVAQLRFETHQFDADLLQLVATRGDRIKIAHDVLMVGLAWGRVKEWILEEIGGEPTGFLAGVTVDEACPMEEGKSYCVRFNREDNSDLLRLVETVAGQNNSLQFQQPLAAEDPWPQPGNIFMFGESGQESIDLVIHSILPKSNLQATIKAVAYTEAIYQADQGTIPPHDPKVTAPQEWWTPVIEGIRSDGAVLWRAPDGSWQSRILVTFRQILSLDTNIAGIEAQYWRTDSLSGPPFTISPVPLADGEISLMPVEDKVAYDFRLRYVKKGGARGPWTEIQTHTVEGKTAPPENVTGFTVYQVREALDFTWNKNPDLDIYGYELRYGPVGCAWEGAEVITEVMLGTSFTTPMIPPGSWDFLNKAVDTSGNYSASEARKTYTVVQFYDIVTDPGNFPIWAGTLTNMVRDPASGFLIPQDQDLPSGNNFEVFDHFVVNPYASYGYEAPEIDLSADTAARAWARITSGLGPGESGDGQSELQMDYRTEAGSYNGFEPWTIGVFMGRCLKFNMDHQASQGNIILKEFQPVVDKAY